MHALMTFAQNQPVQSQVTVIASSAVLVKAPEQAHRIISTKMRKTVF